MFYHTNFLLTKPYDFNRYKNVEDSQDREELFLDFVQELKKKENEDRTKLKDNAIKILNSLYDELLLKSKSHVICLRACLLITSIKSQSLMLIDMCVMSANTSC